MKPVATLEELKQYLSYDPETGVFTWIKKSSKNIPLGIAGNKTFNGYVSIHFRYKSYYAHRLAWFFSYGCWPEKDTDHINGNRIDNRISNLRSVSRRINLQNKVVNRNGKLAGTQYIPSKKRWMARVKISDKLKFLGYFKTESEAHQKYQNYCKENGL